MANSTATSLLANGEVLFYRKYITFGCQECDDYVTGQQKQPHGAPSSMRRQRKSTTDRLTRGDGIGREDLTHMKVKGESSHLIQNETLDITSGRKHSYHHAVLYILLPVQTLSWYRMFNNRVKTSNTPKEVSCFLTQNKALHIVSLNIIRIIIAVLHTLLRI